MNRLLFEDIADKIKEIWLLPKKAKALKDAVDMWQWIALKTYTRNKIVTKKMYFEENGIKEIPKQECYLCEYVKRYNSLIFSYTGICASACPVRDWRESTKGRKENNSCNGQVACYESGSVFCNWESRIFGLELLENLGEGERRDYIELANSAADIHDVIHEEYKKVYKKSVIVEIIKYLSILVLFGCVGYLAGYFLIPFIMGW